MNGDNVKDHWNMIEPKLKSNTEPYADLNAIYELHLLDLENGVYQLHFKSGDVSFHDSAIDKADCVLKMKLTHFKQFLKGDLNSTMAFMTGRLKVDGHISLALKLENMLKKYDFFS